MSHISVFAMLLSSAMAINTPGITDDTSQKAEGIINAPVSKVWKVFTTPEGFKKLGTALCDIDFRVGGLIRTHYNPKGVLGDEGTIQNAILSYEPERMLSIRIQKPPKGFPFSEETWKPTWSVINFTDLGNSQTHLRIVGMGYPNTEDGKKMRKFFEDGNGWTIKTLQSHFDKAVFKPTGAAHAQNPLEPIALEQIVMLPRSELWNYLSSSQGWKNMFGVDSIIELSPGGRFEIFFDSSVPDGKRGSEGCTVLSYLPNQMLSFSWNAPPKFTHARAKHTFVVIHLDELAPNRTRIRLDHLGFAEQAAKNAADRGEWEEVRAYFTVAWGKVLDAIKAKESK